MAGGIYLVQTDSSLVELGEQGYVTEDILQRFLADYPHLMPGDQVDPSSPRRWLFIQREAAVPSEEGGSGRWALDHLFLDQDAIPTLVEVKRASDTRIRREVVGQMLDYAANAVVYWPGDSIRAQFERRCIEESKEPHEELVAFLGETGDAEAFWRQAKENLLAGRIRMIFVADVIPMELLRIIEFLNGQMDPAQVMALEVRQFVGQGLTALVPKVVGQTAAALQKKGSTGQSEKRQWNENSFFTALTERQSPESASVARTLLDWARGQHLRIWWGQGKQDGSFYPMLDHAGDTHWTISVWTYARVYVQFDRLAAPSRQRNGAPSMNEAARHELLDRTERHSRHSTPGGRD